MAKLCKPVITLSENTSLIIGSSKHSQYSVEFQNQADESRQNIVEHYSNGICPQDKKCTESHCIIDQPIHSCCGIQNPTAKSLELEGGAVLNVCTNNVPVKHGLESSDVRRGCENGIDDNVNGDEEKETFSFTNVSGRKKTVLFLCALSRFFAACACSLLGPFYPTEAYKKGMSISMVSFVFGVYGLVIFIVSPIIGKYIGRIGVRFVYVSGIFIGGSCTILFGVLDKGPDGWLFAMMCIICRSVEAVGFACFIISNLTMVSNEYREHTGTVLALIQTSGSLGFMVGPAIGGLLFQLGGFGLPFYLVGSCVLINGLVLYCLIPEIELTPKEKQNTSMLGLLRSPLLVFSLIGICLSNFGLNVYDTLYATHLTPFHLSPAIVGALAMISPFTFTVLAPIWGYLGDVKNIQGAILVPGQFVFGLRFLVAGPSPLLPFVPFTPWTMGVTYAMLGTTLGMISVIGLKCMVKGAYEVKYEKNLRTYAMVSALFNTAFSCGTFSGPFIGGLVVERYGFPNGYTAFGLLNICFGCVLLGYFFFRHFNTRRGINDSEVVLDKSSSDQTQVLAMKTLASNN